MANSIIMPKTGMTMETGVLVKWLKREGDSVKKGEPVAEIETDKSAMELESDFDGIILKILCADGDTIPVAETIAWVGEPGEAVPVTTPISGPAGIKTEQEVSSQTHMNIRNETGGGRRVTGKVPATPAARRRAGEFGVNLNAVVSLPERGYLKAADVTGTGGRVASGGSGKSFADMNATPLAKRIAETKAISLEKVTGSGPGGLIRKEDVLSLGTGLGTEEGSLPEKGFSKIPDSVIPLTSIRKITAKRMFRSHSEIPAVTIAMNADVTKLSVIRKQLNEDLEGEKISINDFVVKAAAFALRKHPRLNAEFADDHLISKGDININIAVDTEHGLMVPVVRNADLLSLTSLSSQAKTLAEKARSRRLSPGDMEGGTFTVSNVGMQGVTFFTPIINQPQTAILGVCAIEERLTRTQGGEFEGRSIMGLCLTFDHRAIDGAEAGRFLQTLKGYLEKPYILLLGR